MRYFSIFSGVGGFEYGIQQALPNTECVGYSEIDKYAIQTYKKNFPKHKNYGDTTKIKPSELPDFDMLCGGFPCQAFSIAGKRRGFKDTRGTLFFEIARIIKIKRPKIVFLENVKGLLNHNEGKTFRIIIQTFSELGYDVQWMVLNSKFFGVPQNRERLFIIGSLRGKPKQKILSFSKTDKKNKELFEEKEDKQMLISPRRIRDLQKSESFITSWDLELFGKVVPEELKILECWRFNHRSTKYGKLSVGNGMTFNDLQKFFDWDITYFLNSILKKGYLVLKEDNKFYSQTCRVVQGRAGYGFLLMRNSWSPTITTLTKTENALIDIINRKVILRRLTPKECERLQGFPDDWSKFGIDKKGNCMEISDIQRYKLMGNAVTTNLIKSIMKEL